MARDSDPPRYEPPTAPAPASKGAAIAVICAAAAAVCLPLTQQSEGLRNRPYLDPAKILTVCYGETQGIDRARIYSTDECAVRLRKRLAEDYAPAIAKCLPGVATERRVKVFGALLDAAYNAGPDAVCSSRMARSIKAGDWSQACGGFYGWYTTARVRGTNPPKRIQLTGLVIRRQKEAALCRQGLEPPSAAFTGKREAFPPAAKLTSPQKTAYSSDWPPMRYRRDNGALVMFVSPELAVKMCGPPEKPDQTRAGCGVMGDNGVWVLAILNPCLFPSDDLYALLVCHELGHINGWPADHGG